MCFKLLILVFIINPAFAYREYWGKKVYIGKGYARSYVRFSQNARLQELGVALSRGALVGLGHTDKEYALDIPHHLRIPPYDHISLNWNPHGHDPDHIYTLPHFDFHFYFITKAQQEAISCMNADAATCLRSIAPEWIPRGYVPGPEGVPLMGWHWADPTSGEFHGQKFTKTFIYGYYDGKTTFVEPMITLDYIKRTRMSVKSIRLPQAFPQTGSYPSVYQVRYDGRQGLHKISLRKFHYYKGVNN